MPYFFRPADAFGVNALGRTTRPSHLGHTTRSRLIRYRYGVKLSRRLRPRARGRSAVETDFKRHPVISRKRRRSVRVDKLKQMKSPVTPPPGGHRSRAAGARAQPAEDRFDFLQPPREFPCKAGINGPPAPARARPPSVRGAGSSTARP